MRSCWHIIHLPTTRTDTSTITSPVTSSISQPNLSFVGSLYAFSKSSPIMALTPAQPALLGMAPELRLQVYKHVFHGATCYTTLHGPVDSMERRANDELKSMMIILQLNKQLRLEAMPVLHERLTVVSFIRDDIPPLPSFCRGAHTLLSDKPINYETCRRSLPNLQTADFFGPTMFINCYTQDDLASMLRGKEDWFHCDRVKSMFNGCNGSDLLYLPTPYNGPSVSCTVTFTIRARIMWTFVGPWGSPCIYVSGQPYRDLRTADRTIEI